MILLLGTNDALLEGLAQALATTGQPVRVTTSIDDAEDLATHYPPLLIVADRARLVEIDGGRMQRIAMAAGSAIVVYREHAGPPETFALRSELARITLADLELPLERNRLVALALYVAARAREVGRAESPSAPDSPRQ